MSLIKWFFAWILSGIAMLFGAGWAAGAEPSREVLGEKTALPICRDADEKRITDCAGHGKWECV